MAKVMLDGLRKEFDQGVVAVAGLDLEIGDGEFVSLVGPSGCGKSTALRMIAGLEEPTGGRILFDGEDATDLEPRDRDVAMVFQSYALYPHMTVRRNLEYGLRKRGVPAEERAERVAHISRMLHIEPFLERKPRQLSGGQRQRVALGRALIRDPRVFLLDEPLSNLDAKLRVHMRAELATLHRQVETTMVYVTHDQLEALTLSDRIIVMNHGEVQQIGTPEEVYTRPRNRFVAEFIGTPAMNLMEGRLTSEAGTPAFAADGLTVPLPPELASAASAERLLLGVRPEDVAIVAPDAPDGVAAEVVLDELAGAERFLYLTVGTTQLVARVAGGTAHAPGARVGFRLPPERLHLFDGTGEDAAALR